MPQGSSFAPASQESHFGLAAVQRRRCRRQRRQAADGPPAKQEPRRGRRPVQWLEDVKATRRSPGSASRTPRARPNSPRRRSSSKLEGDIRAILDSDAKIPGVEKIGAYYYNFWKDEEHERGLWRRTTLAEYRKPRAEVGNGARPRRAQRAPRRRTGSGTAPTACKPDVQALPGRAVARRRRRRRHARVRPRHEAVREGRLLPPRGQGRRWAGSTRTRVYVDTDFGPGSLTRSGYPRIVKEWKRGTPLRAGDARCTKARRGDMYIAACARPHAGLRARLRLPHDRLLQRRAVPARQGRQAGEDRRAESAQQVACTATGCCSSCASPTTAGGKTYAAGALLATNFDDFLAGKRELHRAVRADRRHLARRLRLDAGPPGAQRARRREEPASTCSTPARRTASGQREPLRRRADVGTVSVGAVDADESDAVLLTATDYLTPTTLALGDARQDAAAKSLKTNCRRSSTPRRHVDRAALRHLEGRHARPYFLVAPKDAASSTARTRRCSTATAASRSR